MNHKQKAIIELGKSKGYVLLNDVLRYYPRKEVILDRMGGLVARGLFKQELQINTKEIMWRYVGKI